MMLADVDFQLFYVLIPLIYRVINSVRSHIWTLDSTQVESELASVWRTLSTDYSELLVLDQILEW